MQDYEEKHRETEKQGERIPGTLTHPRKSGMQKGILGKKKYKCQAVNFHQVEVEFNCMAIASCEY